MTEETQIRYDPAQPNGEKSRIFVKNGNDVSVFVPIEEVEQALVEERKRIVESIERLKRNVGERSRCITCGEHIASGDCDCTGINHGLQEAINTVLIQSSK